MAASFGAAAGAARRRRQRPSPGLRRTRPSRRPLRGFHGRRGFGGHCRASTEDAISAAITGASTDEAVSAAIAGASTDEAVSAAIAGASTEDAASAASAAASDDAASASTWLPMRQLRPRRRRRLRPTRQQPRRLPRRPLRRQASAAAELAWRLGGRRGGGGVGGGAGLARRRIRGRRVGIAGAEQQHGGERHGYASDQIELHEFVLFEYSVFAGRRAGPSGALIHQDLRSCRGRLMAERDSFDGVRHGLNRAPLQWREGKAAKNPLAAPVPRLPGAAEGEAERQPDTRADADVTQRRADGGTAGKTDGNGDGQPAISRSVRLHEGGMGSAAGRFRNTAHGLVPAAGFEPATP